MSKSTRPFGRKSSPTVTVIEAKVQRSSARNARIAFVVTALVVALLSATVAAESWHAILAGLFGIVCGLLAGFVVGALVRVWPVVRLIWWWLPEITAGFLLVYGWVALTTHTSLFVTLAVMAVVIGVPAAIGPVRRFLTDWVWCLIVRHRLRVCFSQFIIANQSGTLPLILLARPTPVGERVWIYLRPGLSLADLTSRTDKMAVACHASNVVVDRASDRTAGLLRIDVKRREVLNDTVGSPLVDLVDPDTPTPVRPEPVVPTGLDLPDVAAEPITLPTQKPAKPAAAASANGKKPAPASGEADDLSDWI
ncbi:hypothetical protein [Polymorphospora lycopeni]|uniref:Uncharacterized protein n=1 Tax=Polymorphospora lycopeni TaxID=3140240 RepID=A0ABV5CZI6_9ACTN